ncbi:hypothetical protein L218DRAFT_317689 [Marasmius fiardii PR-910]|nr:hypothetical protein L218DRAFT_317689 [Marasmius fiardii PR-910]
MLNIWKQRWRSEAFTQNDEEDQVPHGGAGTNVFSLESIATAPPVGGSSTAVAGSSLSAPSSLKRKSETEEDEEILLGGHISKKSKWNSDGSKSPGNDKDTFVEPEYYANIIRKMKLGNVILSFRSLKDVIVPIQQYMVFTQQQRTSGRPISLIVAE